MNTESKDTTPTAEAVAAADELTMALQHAALVKATTGIPPSTFERRLLALASALTAKQSELCDAQARVAELQQAVVAASAAERGWRLQAEDARRHAKQCRGYIADIADEVTPEDEDVPTTDGLYEYIVERIKALRTELAEVKKFWLAEKESAGKVYMERDELRGEVARLRTLCADRGDLLVIEQEGRIHHQQRVAAKESELSTLESQLREAEKSHTETIDERDAAEGCIEDLLKLLGLRNGTEYEWSNLFGYAEAVALASEKVAELESQLRKRDGELNDALKELASADRERREAHMQSDRDAARADSCARECSELNAALTAERQHRERLEDVLKSVRVIAPRIVKAIPEYAHEMKLVEETLAESQPALSTDYAKRLERLERLEAALNEERLNAGSLHGKIGLLASQHFGVSDNLPTDETLAAIDATMTRVKDVLRSNATMLVRYAAECFPDIVNGQKDFARVLMESCAEELDAALAQSQPAPAIASSSGAEPSAEPCAKPADKRGEAVSRVCAECGKAWTSAAVSGRCMCGSIAWTAAQKGAE